MTFISVDTDHMTSGNKYGDIRQPNTIINTALNVVIDLPLVENHSEGFRFEKGSQNRSNQKQYHILLAGEKNKLPEKAF
jgi:hypothetical protein